ncbi:MAG: hypothetical protein GY816_04375 [Cytophagales bacterium]|nr:hypothetical protein [Cytophagales bacterium]
MRPFHVLLFLILVLALAIGTSAVWPKDGLPMTREWSLQFATLDELYTDEVTNELNLDSLLASYEIDFDSTAIKDSLRIAEIAYRQKMMRIQYPDTSLGLWSFFKKLNGRRRGVGKVRILHYGDSQIEGDRMTSVIRNKFQKEFGGSGPGYIAASPLVSSFSVDNKRSGNWNRYPVFGKQDSTLNHNHFGMYGVFSRFTPFPVMDTVYQDSIRTQITHENGVTRDTAFIPNPIVQKLLPNDSSVSAWIEISPSKIGYYSSRRYTRMSILFRNPDAPFSMTVTLSDSTEVQRNYPVNSAPQEYKQSFVKSPESIRLEFESISSPDIYGIRLENDFGIVMDNIPMRGSSGTYFGKINHTEMATQFANTNADLIVLQFGGNTVPYMTDEERVERYGKWFASQIRYLKRMNPNTDFVLIGPSDMSTKDGVNYVTYPLLPTIRDVLRTAALDNGCGFWDMFEVMGGKNSMPSWVAADPPLAAPDYVHFSRQGSRKIAELFFDALMKDYEDWKSR